MGKQTLRDELRALLENVPDSYPDFVKVMMHLAARHNNHQDVIDYIKNNPNAQTDDIDEFFDDYET